MIVMNTSHGDIKIKLDDENTPVTAENFRQYVRDAFFNDTIFHRVISGFMIQGGGMLADMSQKKTAAPIKNEAKSGKANKRGTLSMARTSDPHSATAQFFINLVDNAFLDFKAENAQGYGYCVFGEVVEGMDVVDAIAKAKTGNNSGHSDVPVDPIVINSVTEAEE